MIINRRGEEQKISFLRETVVNHASNEPLKKKNVGERSDVR